ncbi:uncharacterized protein LOC130760993 isoform X1 [Actinidia eriantha]|uniref:uncharacterized protein LOC130760993 isoform X1 n=1 Tax=Actinidia eriantha TaxID=165200 RepID=UPI00258E53EC|nr:uncharacterized protein LOC130760993 isoform X1 [Actinidia eriantha]
MAVPEVNKKLLDELEEMGFPLAQATRALHYSGNCSVDAAVNWVFNHQNDPDIDQMPLCSQVPVNIDIDTSDPSNITEEVRLKAQELRDRMRRKNEREEKKLEKEKALEREGEKGRIRAGKEVLEAKRIQEENERKRFMALRKAEKEQEKRERDKIRQKLQQDKVERRRGLGLPLDDPPPVKNASSLPQVDKNSLPVKYVTLPVGATKTGLLRDCLRSLKVNHKDEAKVRRAFQTLLIYIRNVAKNPDEEKFRKIRLSNPAFQDRVGNMKEGTEFLELCGFERDEGDKFLFLPGNKVDAEVLKSAGTVLNSAITNPFFGLLSR